MIQVILASKSPRRREIFSALSIPIRIVTADTDESYQPGTAPSEIVRQLATRKCEAVTQLLREQGELDDNTMIVAADTIVSLDGTIMGKPANAEDAARMLRQLSGKKNQVYTGVAVHFGDRTAAIDDHTDVWFAPLSDKEIAAYVETGEPLDKAGAYGIQERAGFFSEKIEGDFSTVVGFPVFAFGTLLRRQFSLDPFDLMRKEEEQ